MKATLVLTCGWMFLICVSIAAGWAFFGERGAYAAGGFFVGAAVTSFMADAMGYHQTESRQTVE